MAKVNKAMNNQSLGGCGKRGKFLYCCRFSCLMFCRDNLQRTNVPNDSIVPLLPYDLKTGHCIPQILSDVYSYTIGSSQEMKTKIVFNISMDNRNVVYIQ